MMELRLRKRMIVHETVLKKGQTEEQSFFGAEL